MGKALSELRADAGYKSAREFAEVCGFSPSSLARYEKEQESTPIKPAWTMADVLGCTIDDVVGRVTPATADMRGEFQRRYDALHPALRPMLDALLDYLEEYARISVELWHREFEDAYMQMLKVNLLTYMETLDEDEKTDQFLHGSAERNRNAFQSFLEKKVHGDNGLHMNCEEVMDGVMQAYDRFYA